MPAWRSKHDFTSCVQPDDDWPYWCELACGNRYGFWPVGSKASDCSYASTKGWIAGGSVLICGP